MSDDEDSLVPASSPTFGLTEQQALALTWVKVNLADPFVALTHRELDVREKESVRELQLAEGELKREHIYKMRALHISAGLMVLLVSIAGGLLFFDKETGLVIISMIAVGLGTYSYGRRQQ